METDKLITISDVTVLRMMSDTTCKYCCGKTNHNDTYCKKCGHPNSQEFPYLKDTHED